MSYQVLARKWRPKNFAELVGQEHVVRALVNGLDNDRLHHAFLFTGTRGVGKTTIARIFAKALNCETGVKSEPCGQCSSCTEIDEGRFIDLIEVDAASRTKVDETRDLLDNVQYAPSRGRYKVYLIDEVHMFSGHSFNALLKTLEEPPPHVKFLLATTDPQKLPVTVLSRCLQFNLKRMPAQQIAPYLGQLLEQEKVEADAEALDLIAEAAAGSMRDGLSLLDQAIAHGGGAVKAEEVRAMLGTVERRHTLGLLKALAERDSDALWESCTQLAAFSPNFSGVLGDLATALHRMAIAAAIGQQANGQILQQELAEIAAAMSPEDIQLYYQIATHGRRDLDLAPDQQTGFEMTMLRMLAFVPADEVRSGDAVSSSGQSESGGPGSAGGSGGTKNSPASDARAEAARIAGVSAAPGEQKSKRPPDRQAERPELAETRLDSTSLQASNDTQASQPTPGSQRTPPSEHAGGVELAVASAGPVDFGHDNLGWDDLISHLGLAGPAGAAAANSVLRRKDHGIYKVTLDRQHMHLHTPGIEQKITEALQRFFGKNATIVFEVGELEAESPALKQTRVQDENLRAATAAIESDPAIQGLQRDFAATIVADSVKFLN